MERTEYRFADASCLQPRRNCRACRSSSCGGVATFGTPDMAGRPHSPGVLRLTQSVREIVPCFFLGRSNPDPDEGKAGVYACDMSLR